MNRKISNNYQVRVKINTKDEISKIEKACRVVADTLSTLKNYVNSSLILIKKVVIGQTDVGGKLK